MIKIHQRYKPEDVNTLILALKHRADAKNYDFSNPSLVDFFSLEFHAKNCNDKLLKFFTKHLERKYNVYAKYEDLKHMSMNDVWKVMIELRQRSL